MPDLVNTVTLELRRAALASDFDPNVWKVVPRDVASVNTVTLKYPARVASTTTGPGRLIYTPDIEAVPPRYRKWVVDHVEAMTSGEKSAADAGATSTALAASRAAALAALTDPSPNLARAAVLVLHDRINALCDAASHPELKQTLADLRAAIDKKNGG